MISLIYEEKKIEFPEMGGSALPGGVRTPLGPSFLGENFISNGNVVSVLRWKSFPIEWKGYFGIFLRFQSQNAVNAFSSLAFSLSLGLQHHIGFSKVLSGK